MVSTDIETMKERPEATPAENPVNVPKTRRASAERTIDGNRTNTNSAAIIAKIAQKDSAVDVW